MDSDIVIDEYFDGLDMHLDVPFVPTDEGVVSAMLKLAAVDADDVLYDLGSGDGRIVVAAASECGASAVGVEIDAGRVQLAKAYAEEMGVEHKVCFLEDDLFTVDFSPATVVTMYLMDTVNLNLRPRLLSELRPGTRIVSHAFDMGDWKPDRRVPATGTGLYLWVVPARLDGTWEWEPTEGQRYRVELSQQYQRLTGSLWVNDQFVELEAALLWGDLLELVVRYENAYEPQSIVLHCRDDRLVVVGDYQQGAVAKKV